MSQESHVLKVLSLLQCSHIWFGGRTGTWLLGQPIGEYSIRWFWGRWRNDECDLVKKSSALGTGTGTQRLVLRPPTLCAFRPPWSKSLSFTLSFHYNVSALLQVREQQNIKPWTKTSESMSHQHNSPLLPDTSICHKRMNPSQLHLA